MRYTAGKLTGVASMDGAREIGILCPHWHRTLEAAERCATKQGEGWIALKETAVPIMPKSKPSGRRRDPNKSSSMPTR